MTLKAKKVKTKKPRKNPETAFGFVPQVKDLTVKQIEEIIIAVDEALELFDGGKSKRADSILHRLENYYGKRNVEQIYYFRKLNRY